MHGPMNVKTVRIFYFYFLHLEIEMASDVNGRKSLLPALISNGWMDVVTLIYMCVLFTVLISERVTQ